MRLSFSHINVLHVKATFKSPDAAKAFVEEISNIEYILAPKRSLSVVVDYYCLNPDLGKTLATKFEERWMSRSIPEEKISDSISSEELVEESCFEVNPHLELSQPP